VYPIIPITIGYFGSQAGKSGRSPVALSLIYLLGMAMMYSALGVLAGLTGGLFGAQLQNPWVLGVFALVMFGLSLSQFDRPNGMPIWEFQLPAALRNKTGSRAGAAGAFVMGLLVGVVAAPCIGPAVIALLQWVGSQRSAFLGFIIFFTLSLGLGLPYVVLASLSGSVRKIPRSGEWMMGVKHFFGWIMIWMGFYYLQTLLDRLHPGVGGYTLAAITAAAGIFLFLDRAGSNARVFHIFRKVVGVGVIAAAIWMALPSRSSSIQWRVYSPDALQEASAQHKNILIDFSANWCVACKELENKTFTDKKVGDAARDFSAFKVDMTDFASPEAQRLKEQYGIAGLPTVARLTPKEDAH
jgi:thiol:disulfide interchange protein DsbD